MAAVFLDLCSKGYIYGVLEQKLTILFAFQVSWSLPSNDLPCTLLFLQRSLLVHLKEVYKLFYFWRGGVCTTSNTRGKMTLLGQERRRRAAEWQPAQSLAMLL